MDLVPGRGIADYTSIEDQLLKYCRESSIFLVVNSARPLLAETGVLPSTSTIGVGEGKLL